MSTFLLNSFQTPNSYVDELMPFLTGEEWKVISYMARRIFGFHKRQDRISLNQLVDGIVSKVDGHRLDYGTGLNKTTVRKAVASLKSFNIVIYDDKETTNDGTLYSLQLDSTLVNYEALHARKAQQYTRNRQRGENGLQSIQVKRTGVSSDDTPQQRATESDSGVPSDDTPISTGVPSDDTAGVPSDDTQVYHPMTQHESRGNPEENQDSAALSGGESEVALVGEQSLPSSPPLQVVFTVGESAFSQVGGNEHTNGNGSGNGKHEKPRRAPRRSAMQHAIKEAWLNLALEQLGLGEKIPETPSEGDTAGWARFWNMVADCERVALDLGWSAEQVGELLAECYRYQLADDIKGYWIGKNFYLKSLTPKLAVWWREVKNSAPKPTRASSAPALQPLDTSDAERLRQVARANRQRGGTRRSIPELEES